MTILAAAAQDDVLAVLLLDLAIVAACALALGGLARRVGQAAVIGEIVAGMLLGPSLLGLLPGHLDELLFPAFVRPYLVVLANVALVLFLFGIGYEVDLGRIRRSGRAVVRVATASVLVPAVAGVAIAPVLWAAHPPVADGVSKVQFAAFIAIVLSVTALPVLARVLADAGLTNTPLGGVAVVVAAMTDLVSWIALAALLATLGTAAGGSSVGETLVALGVLVAVLAFVVRPLLRLGLEQSWCKRHGPTGASLLLLAALALCAAATTQLGLHPGFGAFALGVACPRACVPRTVGRGRPAPSEEASEPAAAGAAALSAAGLVLVPLYFIVTGLKIDVTGIGLEGVAEVCALLVVATVAKVVGVAWAARSDRDLAGGALALGLLLNTRGLTELIVLDIGRGAGIIGGELFTVLVLVTLLTTAMTMPLLPYALRGGRRAKRVRVARGAPELSGS